MARKRGQLELTGAEAVERIFRELGERVQRKVLRQAVNAAATPVVKAARAKAPKESGTLKKSMGKKVKAYRKTQTAVAVVGPRNETTGEYRGKVRRPAKYAHLVEGGHVNADGSHTPAKPFLRPAFDESKEQALDAMKSKLAAGVVREAKKAAGGK